LKLFDFVNMDGSFPMRHSTVDELEGFKDFSLALGMLSATVNAANFAQIYPICPKLQKFAKICPNLEL
jgi:hypothetical protein